MQYQMPGMRVIAATCIAYLCGGALAVAGDPPQAATVLEEFNMADDGDALLVPVFVAGARRLFLVDTGAGVGMFDKSLRHALGKARGTVTMHTPGGQVRRELFRPPEATLGRLQVYSADDDPSPAVICEDLGSDRFGSSQRIEGVLGFAFLRRYVMRLDFDAGKISFLTTPGPDAGKRVPIIMVRDIPLVRTTIPGISDKYSTLHIDTGHIGDVGGFHPVTMRELFLHKLVKRTSGTDIATEAGIGHADGVRLAQFELAGFRHSNLVFISQSEGTPSTLGLGYWSRFIVTFDFPNRALYLKPSKRFALPDYNHLHTTSRMGISLERRNDRIRITYVSAGMPAARAGLKKGDILLAVGETDVSAARPFTVHSLFDAAQGQLELAVLRRSRRTRVLIAIPPRPPADIDVHAKVPEDPQLTNSAQP